MPTDTTDARFTGDVLESDAPVVVDSHAAWCPPCRVMSPILAERPDLRFVKLDVDENAETAVRYGVLSMPTFMVFRDGEPVLKLVGARRKRRLVEELGRGDLGTDFGWVGRRVRGRSASSADVVAP